MKTNNPWSKWKVLIKTHIYMPRTLPDIGTQLIIESKEIKVWGRSQDEAEKKAISKVKGHKQEILSGKKINR